MNVEWVTYKATKVFDRLNNNNNDGEEQEVGREFWHGVYSITKVCRLLLLAEF